MQKQWLEHFCKYRHICEFLGSEGKEKEEIKEYLMQELRLPEATTRYQMTRALSDEDGIVKSFGWKFYLDEEKFKAVIEDLRSIYPIRLKPYPYPPKEEMEARDGLIELKKKYVSLQSEYDLLRYRYLDVKVSYYDAKSDLTEAKGDEVGSCRYFEKMDSGFLFLDKNGRPRVALHWEKYFQLSVRKYNNIYRVQLPQITPHVCRHTFCTNMAKSGMNPKVLQYIMGHGDISVTLDTYTHIKSEDAIAEMERLDLLTEKET